MSPTVTNAFLLRNNDTNELFTFGNVGTFLDDYDEFTTTGLTGNTNDNRIDVDAIIANVNFPGGSTAAGKGNGQIYQYQESATPAPICFTPASRLETPFGPLPVGTLRVGDMVQTKDNGFQPIRWIYKRHISAEEFAYRPTVAPIVIRKGALGNGLPENDVALSQGHMLLIDDKQLLRPWDDDEALVPAKQLLRVPGVSRRYPRRGVTYIHLLFDNHEIVKADGTRMESFLPNQASLEMIDGTEWREIFDIFPDLRNQPAEDIIPPARTIFYRNNADRLAKRMTEAVGA